MQGTYKIFEKAGTELLWIQTATKMLNTPLTVQESMILLPQALILKVKIVEVVLLEHLRSRTACKLIRISRTKFQRPSIA